MTDLLKAYFQIEDRDDQRKIREKLTGKPLTLDEALRSMLPALLTLLDVPVEDSQWQALDPPQRRQKTLDAVKTLLLRESQVQPLCLVFEDLHWIDSETQAFLDNLVESLPTTQVLLLVNYRPEYQHGWGNKTYYGQHYHRGERRDAVEHARAAMEIGTDQGFPVVRSFAAGLLGRLMVAEGHYEEGIAQISDSLAALRKRRTGGGVGRRGFLISLLVETWKEGRQTKDGLELLANELGREEHRGCEAELLRLKGELLLGRSVPAEQEAQGCFREAIELSRRQDAKSLQLRAVTSLSRLLHQQGKNDEARQMLAEIYGWFTEGFDTADLKEAKALLDELS